MTVAALSPRTEPPVPICTGGWVRPKNRFGRYGVKKKLAPAGNRRPVVQRVAHRYTDKQHKMSKLVLKLKVNNTFYLAVFTYACNCSLVHDQSLTYPFVPLHTAHITSLQRLTWKSSWIPAATTQN
jgi:hypothetical protein